MILIKDSFYLATSRANASRLNKCIFGAIAPKKAKQTSCQTCACRQSLRVAMRTANNCACFLGRRNCAAATRKLQRTITSALGSRPSPAEPGYFCPAAFHRAINRAFYGEPPGWLPRLREIRRSPIATEPGHGTRKPSLFRRGTESRAASHVVDWGSGDCILIGCNDIGTSKSAGDCTIMLPRCAGETQRGACGPSTTQKLLRRGR